MKLLIVANACEWASWPQKIANIKAFYAPLVDLEIDIQYTDFTDIPLKSYPGTVTHFENGAVTDAAGSDLEIDQDWFNLNIGTLIAGYDIAVFQAANVAATGLPIGIKFEDLNGTWCCETFVPDENFHYYLPGVNGAIGVNMGIEAEVIIEHEIAHALYSITGQPDRTHEFFYANQFARVLTDINVGPHITIISLYQQVVADLESELGILKANQSTVDMNTTQSVDTLVPWVNAVGSENNRHNVRVLCDLAGLALYDKNVITACIEQESDFDPQAIGKPNANGTIDYGICQFNNGELHGVPLWIGEGAYFTSTDEVLRDPTKCVNEMIAQYKLGHINWWSSYSTGAYLKFMPQGTPA